MTPAHHIIIVGGGAAGLELTTKLGNKLGKKHLADIEKSKLRRDTALLRKFDRLHICICGAVKFSSRLVSLRILNF